jgi:protocatechuate 3,4-dioxygenase beta subunit
MQEIAGTNSYVTNLMQRANITSNKASSPIHQYRKGFRKEGSYLTETLFIQSIAMKIILLSSLVLFNSCRSTAQPGDETILNEATTKLQNKSATVSVILTEKKYLSIHPLTGFRELIKANCNTDMLKITTPDEPGKKIRVLGTVNDKDGKPVAAALVYLYQTDYRGWYAADAPHVLTKEGDMRHARLFGYVKTDAKGKFELQTVKPSGYPRSDLPAHIHVHVTTDGYKSYVTEFLFDDDDRLVGKIREQAVQNRFLIARPEKATVPFVQQCSYNIVLEKQ